MRIGSVGIRIEGGEGEEFVISSVKARNFPNG
jgi:hypothetical protein